MASSRSRLGELSAAIAAGRRGPVDIIDETLERISRRDPALGAFAWVDAAGAQRAARELAAELAAGRRRGPLHGIPIAVKELVDVAGAPNDGGSDALPRRHDAPDAELVRRLRAAGAVIVGTTRSHEGGWGITTTHPRRISTRNPWDPERIAGGSSGGSAAAVAACLVPVAIGTDTAGSIRIPSSFCGVAGIKPTFGSVPRDGVLPLAPSFDTVGVIADSVADLRPVLAALADTVRPGVGERANGIAGLVIGIEPELAEAARTESDATGYAAIVSALCAAGATVVDLAPLPRDEIAAAYTTLHLVESYGTHTTLQGAPPETVAGYAPDVRDRMLLATRVDSAEHAKAQARRAELVVRLEAAMVGADAIVGLVSLTPPSRLDDPDRVMLRGRTATLREAVMKLVLPQSLAGLPAVAIPSGIGAAGTPCGVQVWASAGRDDIALAVAQAIHDRVTPLFRRPTSRTDTEENAVG